MRLLKFVIIFLAIPSIGYTQNDLTVCEIPDSVTGNTTSFAQYLKRNYSTDESIIQAVFNWEARNISYDYENLGRTSKDDNNEKIILRTLKTRKAVCQGYCETFNEICNKAGLTTFVVVGYTRQNGQVDKLSHSWIAAFLGGKWFFYDPTWAAGYLREGKFVQHFNKTWYKVIPGVFIESHIPFDPLWQLLDFPVSASNWQLKMYSGKTGSFFNYNDSIKVLNEQDKRTQLISEIRRIEANGITNELTRERIKFLRRQISISDENDRIAMENSMVDDFNNAVISYNSSSKLYNQYVSSKTKSQKSRKLPDELRVLLEKSQSEISLAEELINRVKTMESSRKRDVQTIRQAIKKLQNQIRKERTSMEIQFKDKKK